MPSSFGGSRRRRRAPPRLFVPTQAPDSPTTVPRDPAPDPDLLRDDAAEIAARPGAADDAALSAKCVLFLELLSGSLERGDKVVAFTQSLATLDVLAHLLSHPTWGGYLADPGGGRGGWAAGADFLRIEGADGALERHRKIEAFDAGDAGGGGGARVFLLSTRAGNMGVNLVAANRVVLFDTSWNPAVDRQALFRRFRFGQAKRVFIYRLVAEGFEARVFRRATQKDILARRVVDDEALERLYAFGDLTDARDDSASESEDEGAAAPPPPVADDVLRRTLEVWGELVASAAETDALFVENDDERLAEAERADAIDEYRRRVDPTQPSLPRPSVDPQPSLRGGVDASRSAVPDAAFVRGPDAASPRSPSDKPRTPAADDPPSPGHARRRPGPVFGAPPVQRDCHRCHRLAAHARRSFLERDERGVDAQSHTEARDASPRKINVTTSPRRGRGVAAIHQRKIHFAAAASPRYIRRGASSARRAHDGR